LADLMKIPGYEAEDTAQVLKSRAAVAATQMVEAPVAPLEQPAAAGPQEKVGAKAAANQRLKAALKEQGETE
jgi:hypothetical protein